MKPAERSKAETNTGKKPKQYIVGKDALAVYVHKKNPLEKISITQLAEVYGEGGKITKWSDLGASVSGE